MKARRISGGESLCLYLLTIALLFDICNLVAVVTSLQSSLGGLILKQVSKLLAPVVSSSSDHRPTPNDHVLALRCLSTLPPSAWDGALGQAEMKAVMDGINSYDDTIRLTVSDGAGILARDAHDRPCASCFDSRPTCSQLL